MAQGSTRFENLEKPIDDYIIEQQNKNTRVKTTRDVKLLIEFLREKHDQRNPEDIEAEELNEYLCEFILSVKRKDGKDFEPSSLRGMFSSFNRHLKECKYPVSVIEDVAFERARKCLEAKNKQLKKEGKGNRPNAAENLSLYIINKLHHGKCFCTIFTHSFVFTKLTRSQSLARSFCENKLVRKYRTSALSMKKSIYIPY